MTELSNSNPTGQGKKHALHLSDELVSILSHNSAALECFPAHAVNVAASPDGALYQLNTQHATLETDVVLKMQHCAKRSTSIAYALKLIRSTQRHQLDHAHRALNAKPEKKTYSIHLKPLIQMTSPRVINGVLGIECCIQNYKQRYYRCDCSPEGSLQPGCESCCCHSRTPPTPFKRRETLFIRPQSS